MCNFFCGPDCQRLVRCPSSPLHLIELTSILQVWFAHKRVCGRSCVGGFAKLPSEPCGTSTDPFSFPLLSKKHANEAISIAFVHSESMANGVSSIGRVIKDSLQCPAADIEVRLASLLFLTPLADRWCASPCRT